ncbi:Oxygen sensor protein DosP [Anaerotruncus sp. 2789STDY5834896]|uniref:Oxygen sensor protein DosP n=1 Tax=uncultured Anaerotruncus sp. TaxID=905011 RepID=A0A1C6JV88_9FIRM|nr:Oxygen sensor protein DosP [uncultured Anaerotruncus sp.]
MQPRTKSVKKIYFDVGLTVLIVVLFAAFFSFQVQKDSRERVLTTLSEISSQSVEVMQKEISRNKTLLINLAVLLGQEETLDPPTLLQKLIPVDKENNFKRMGIVLPDHTSYSTDHKDVVLDDEGYARFASAMEGQTSVTNTVRDLVDGESVTVYSTPLTFADGSRCVLFGTYSTQYYKNLLSVSSFKGAGYSYIIRQNGDCISGSTNLLSQQFSNFYSATAAYSRQNEEKVQRLQEAVQNGEQGVMLFDREDGTQRYLYYQPLEVGDWYLLSVVPSEVIDKSINGTLVPTYLLLLGSVLLFCYLIWRIVAMYRGYRDRVEQLVMVDEVTGQGSFAKFRLDAAALFGGKDRTPYALVCLNVKKFQYINDLYGYDEGNAVLRTVAECIGENIAGGEYAARMQADLFVLLLHCRDVQLLQNRVTELLHKVQARADKRDGDLIYQVRLRAGVYPVQDRTLTLEGMIDRAKLAMDHSRQNASQPCGLYDGALRRQLVRQQELANHFDGALESGQLQLYFQPKYDLQAGSFHGAEALVRWHSPQNGWISPGAFIPVLEQNGGIIDLDRRVFAAVCRQMRRWLDAGLQPGPISVNASQLHLYRLDFVDRYLAVIDRYHLPHDLIQIELTETALFENRDILAQSLGRFRRHGVQILMDDFGSGFSSVGSVCTMPIDAVKIDKSMVDHLVDDEKTRLILKNSLALFRSLGLAVVVEGVEQKDQYDLLHTMQADYIQGYYCARPMPMGQYQACLQKAQGLPVTGQDEIAVV